VKAPVPLQQPLEPKPVAKEPSKAKTTINLGSILKPAIKPEDKQDEVRMPIVDKSFQADDIRRVWKEYADLRKDQVAEYHLLNQQIEIQKNEVLICMTNPIEEPLLASMKSDLVGYLREKLNNGTIQVKGELKIAEGKQRIAYTNKEKFEVLLDRNPLLRELKDRFALDADF
jgi:DNA polymerase-3 subunit gamma/tau